MDNDSSNNTILIHQSERMYYTKRTDWKNFPMQDSTRTEMEIDTAVSYHFLLHLKLPEMIWKCKNIKNEIKWTLIFKEENKLSGNPRKGVIRHPAWIPKWSWPVKTVDVQGDLVTEIKYVWRLRSLTYKQMQFQNSRCKPWLLSSFMFTRIFGSYIKCTKLKIEIMNDRYKQNISNIKYKLVSRSLFVHAYMYMKDTHVCRSEIGGECFPQWCSTLLFETWSLPDSWVHDFRQTSWRGGFRDPHISVSPFLLRLEMPIKIYCVKNIDKRDIWCY